jgi:tetratricopeptide (TPR) repeat protein
MKGLAIWACAAAFTIAGCMPSLAQDEAQHDNGLGGTGMGGLGAPMTQGSTFSEDPYRTAIRLIHHEKYSEAIPYIDQAAADKPTNSNVLSYAGYAHGKIGEYGTSLEYLKRALAGDPDHKAAHEYLGEDYLAMHNMAAANAQLAELARLCPGGCDEKEALSKAIADYQSRLATASSPAVTAH